MKNKWKKAISIAMASAMVMGTPFAGMTSMVYGAESCENLEIYENEGQRYYIDAVLGNDENDGLSEQKAWKSFANLKGLSLTAGDAVLLKAGCEWNDEQLEICNAKGSEEHPVILGKYGEGANPKINGNGNSWKTNHAVSDPKEDVAVVHIYNSEYITIENLEVTNWETDTQDLQKSGKKYKESKYLLTGILVENEDASTLSGIVIRNNYVHDINGYMSKNGTEGEKKGSGGIIALVTGGEVESSFSNLKILGNQVENVCHEAIYMESIWAARKLVGGANSQQAGSKKWVGWKDVYVANNYVKDVAGDGIVLINADGGMAEYNLVTGAASEDWDSTNNPAHAAIWMWDCNNVTMQYNEASHTMSTQDGMAFDCDYGNQNVMYQYNYSHDNKGGFFMSCPGPYYSVNNVVRYNVSVNDGLFDGGRIIRIGEEGSKGVQIYNNTIYWDTGYDVQAVEQGSWTSGVNGNVKAESSGTDIYNNIFYGNSGSVVNNDGVRYKNNCVYGTVKKVYPVMEDTTVRVANPKFVEALDTTEGRFENGVVTLGTVDGLKLTEESCCIGNGQPFMAVPNETHEAVKDEMVPTHITLPQVDYEGNPITEGNISIGAFGYSGAHTEATADTSYLKELLKVTEGYQKEEYDPISFASFEETRDRVRQIVENEVCSESFVTAYTMQLEEALKNLKKTSSYRNGTIEDNILSAADSTFETDELNWGYWQADRELSTEHAYSGEKSLHVKQTSSPSTGYSELGGIDVEENQKYILEAMVYIGDADPTKVGLEAKHHNSYTNGAGDIKLVEVSGKAENVSEGWCKISASFTTREYNKLSISVCSNISDVYLDDVFVYPEVVQEEVSTADRSGLLALMDMEPNREKSYYSQKSWNTYWQARTKAGITCFTNNVSQADIDAAGVRLQEAFAQLAKKTDARNLNELILRCSQLKKENYTKTSYAALEKQLKNAKSVAGNDLSTQSQIDDAFEKLLAFEESLVEDKTVVVTVPAQSSVTSGKMLKGKKVYLSWKKVSNATGYEIELATKSNFKSGLKKIVVKKNTTTKTTVSKLKANTVYYVRVRAYKEQKINGKTVKVTGPYSSVKKLKKSMK